MTDRRSPSGPKPKRHLKNYLLDKKFQLTYALIIVFIAVLLTGLLGFLIFHQTAASSRLHDRQSIQTIRIFKTQSQETINVFRSASKRTETVFTQQSDQTKKVFKEKTATATGILNVIASQKEKIPDLAAMAELNMQQMQKDDKKDIATMSRAIDKAKKALKSEMDKGIKKKESQLAHALEKMKRDRTKARVIRAENDKRILIGVVFFSLVFIIIVFLYTIVLTHKVAGPLLKVSSYLKKMEENNFSKIWPLRKGDQLQEFYGKFERAHVAIVARIHQEIASLNAIYAQLDKESEAATKLKALIEEKERSLGDNC